jgi:hypothetical protein
LELADRIFPSEAKERMTSLVLVRRTLEQLGPEPMTPEAKAQILPATSQFAIGRSRETGEYKLADGDKEEEAEELEKAACDDDDWEDEEDDEPQIVDRGQVQDADCRAAIGHGRSAFVGEIGRLSFVIVK